ncbi:restriction endonuclease subunit S [Fructilactobacillus carniphilus]|uniref:Restriction endonuclease subunit S n=1 Tax=Fructilactobacillus carniphilus TaxID=2940297 RepID=A0ABY5C036_9LACO|nr:restriction endonuclease subunit S [Fructilactobacillus carniphilus]USS90655.1 restriction endonuclease subunit S [Fructilactobacillus carniphilus]
MDKIEIDRKQNEVKKGDVFFTTSSETPLEVGMSSVWIYNYKNIYLNSFSFGYRPTYNFNLNYLAFMLRSQNIRKNIVILAQGISRFNISKSKIMNIMVPIPDLDEQEKIGNLFKKIDDLITVNQHKLEQLKLLKKALLQQLFPQNDEITPQIRFANFHDDWDYRKLGEMGKSFSGISGKTKQDFGHGNAKYVTYINVFKNPITSKFALDKIEIDKKQIEVKCGDIFFTTSSETPNEVGMSSVWKYNMPNVYLNSFSFGYRLLQEVDLNYLAFMLRSQNIRRKIILLAQGISRFNISKTKMMDISIPIPEIKEQEKIGNIILKVDNRIDTCDEKIKHIKDLKKALLEKMFL